MTMRSDDRVSHDVFSRPHRGVDFGGDGTATGDAVADEEVVASGIDIQVDEDTVSFVRNLEPPTQICVEALASLAINTVAVVASDPEEALVADRLQQLYRILDLLLGRQELIPSVALGVLGDAIPHVTEIDPVAVGVGGNAGDVLPDEVVIAFGSTQVPANKRINICPGAFGLDREMTVFHRSDEVD